MTDNDQRKENREVKKEWSWKAKWIMPAEKPGEVCPRYQKQFCVRPVPVEKARLQVTAMGVYTATLNGSRIGDDVLAPGWTVYAKRLQVQKYDVTELLQEQIKYDATGEEIQAQAGMELAITVGKGWYRSPMPAWISEEERAAKDALPPAVTACLTITYADGVKEKIKTDTSWRVAPSAILFSEIYDGEIYDATKEAGQSTGKVVYYEYSGGRLVPKQGERIKEQERVIPGKLFTTPKGERVLDFGQEITGYVQFMVDAKSGDQIVLSHGEVLDKQGNFYTDNYRGAKAKIAYTCREGIQTWHPQMTFFGFRYIRLDQFPGHPTPEQFVGIAVYSEMKRTGDVVSGSSLLNQLFQNVLWGQRGNFLDVPTDCPQRDERMGWTGDAQAFVRTASYNFDVERFFTKWLADLALDQRTDGSIPHVIPAGSVGSGSAAWDDAATICPWQIYLTYGDSAILRNQWECMKRYVDYIGKDTTTPYLWTGGEHYGDWLGLDAPSGSYKGSSREDFIASAFYAHSAELLIKAGKVLKEDVSSYEKLYEQIVEAFRATYPEYQTQTEYVLAVYFGLAPDLQKAADELAIKVHADGDKLQTGFVGTPYILHVLSAYGYAKLAYTLLLRTEYPSWLYPVTKGATTIWEHWDGIMPNGDFWSRDMNSFNHYAYGAVTDWIYGVAAGIQTVEEKPGFAQIRIAPHPDKRLGWLRASIRTRYGVVESKWSYTEQGIRYEIRTPVETLVQLGESEQWVSAGNYVFFD